MLPPPLPACALLVPVKAPAVGKSRLGVADDRRRSLARAFALDTLTAACAASAGTGSTVYVVTADRDLADEALALGARHLPDGDGLNPSLVASTAALPATLDLVVALCADLPALSPRDLGAALRALDPARGGFVADTERTGTTLYAAPARAFAPCFGPGSADAHRSQDRPELDGVLATLRRDVDDLDSLAEALALGVGPHTHAVLAEH